VIGGSTFAIGHAYDGYKAKQRRQFLRAILKDDWKLAVSNTTPDGRRRARFFVARIAHAIIYTIGIPVLRTLVFGVSIAGEVMILLQILR
jgi:uncharacterized MAPEG superfamily protein